ncbi:helix-turn-helix domain-containing protein [Algibacter mikhailovii]|uniref:helix-turn-helix domain-containing protein n=1 Tax=Algibacter mikhailovii TaxID=425498 RepID=UPI002494443C|nr:helix-turn-helix domain-containing protein [Algibacter mikhailovii]
MTNKSILLNEITPEQLQELISSSVKSQFVDFKKAFVNLQANDELLTREEACNFLKIDPSTLWHWTNKGKVLAFGIGNRRYYKRAQLLECIKPLKK